MTGNVREGAVMWVRAYGRKSRKLGDPDEVDIATIVGHQFADCDRHLAAVNIFLKPEERIAEIGSGESLDERPEFAALLKEIELHPPGDGLLVVSEIARISRADMYEFGWIVRILQTAGIKVLAGGRRWDLSHPDDYLLFGIFAGMAHHELGTYKLRV